MGSIRIVLGTSSLAGYIQGGGHWSVRLQYLLGLRDLGCDVHLIEVLKSAGHRDIDHQRIHSFFARMDEYGLAGQCFLLLIDKRFKDQSLELASTYGGSERKLREVIAGADLLWNFCCHIRNPLLSMFRHRVLLDLDPGHLHVAALTVGMDLYEHDSFLTVGTNLHSGNSEVPTLGLQWHGFTPFVYLPMWEESPDPGADAPFTSVTHWTWGKELMYQDRMLGTSKRDGYLRYLDLPHSTKRPFELAANITPKDATGDREILENHGWRVVDPWKVANSPASYQTYIGSSRAEISCPKPVFRELRSGWFSDRSSCYLASGRPVLAEDTGFSETVPCGQGLLVFRNLSEAIAGVEEIDSHYVRHMRAARELAHEFLDSRRCLEKMLSQSSVC